MDEQKTDLQAEGGAPRHGQENADVKQFKHWVDEYGRPLLIGLALAVVLILGYSIWKNNQQNKAVATAQSLFSARQPEEFRDIAANNPAGPIAPVALATAAAEFYTANRFDEALDAYRGFLEQYPEHQLADDARMGVASSLEAIGQYDEAAAAYEGFAKTNPDSRLYPQAAISAARVLEQLGRFDEARAWYEDLIVSQPTSVWVPQAESGLLLLGKTERAAKAAPVPPVAVPDAPQVEVVFDSSVDEVVPELPEPVVFSAAEVEEELPADEEVVAVVEEDAVVLEEAAPDGDDASSEPE